MVNLDDDPEEIMRKIKESVAEHGEQGIVDVRALEMRHSNAAFPNRSVLTSTSDA